MNLDLWANHTDCTDGEGRPKRRYYSLEQAQNMVTYLQQEKGIQLRAYLCDRCGYYHVTHSPYFSGTSIRKAIKSL